MRIAARAPNHLGDGVMALPALRGLARCGALTIHAPRWGADLYRELDVPVVPARRRLVADVAVLFAPSLRAAIQARSCRRVVGTPTDSRRWLLTDVVPQRTHRRQTYAALAACVGASVGPASYGVRGQPADVPANHLGLNPIIATGDITRQWRRFRALADQSDRPVVFYAGPGEADRLRRVAGRHRCVVGLTLPDFAATLERCAVFVSNDSGSAHFARAVGRPVVVVHGSTSAARTGPRGAHPVETALPCHPCYRPTCAVGVGCLDASVDRVARTVERASEGPCFPS